MFESQGVVNNQLSWNDGVDQRRISTLGGDGVAQACQIDQSCLTQDVVADDASRKPWEVALTLAIDQLNQGILQDGRIATAHEVFRVYARSVGKGVIRPGLDLLDGRAGVEIIEVSARKGFPISGIHCVSFPI